MIFTDFLFLSFLPILIFINIIIRSQKTAQKILIIVVSILFFLSWGGADVFLFIIILTINFPVSILIEKQRDYLGKVILLIAVSFNILILSYFKYFRFIFIETLGLEAHAFLMTQSPWAPLGLSFYTFHILSYLVDIWERKYDRAKFVDYLAYISFFPHLIAGPIVRGHQLIPQFQQPLEWRNFKFASGLLAFATGFLLKTSADGIARLIDKYWILEAARQISTTDAWSVSILFSFQIFGDFAGYSYMAIGISRWLGYELPQNFNLPYFALTFRTFWHRWHITLSEYLRDYLYIRVFGGSRNGLWRGHLNTFLTMLIGGLWHGANWTFVVWGALHGAALVFERLLGLDGKKQRSILIKASWYLAVQICVIVAWVFFRSPNFSTAAAMLNAMAGRGLQSGPYIPNSSLIVALPIVAYYAARGFTELYKFRNSTIEGALAIFMLFAGIMLLDAPSTFIYFEF